MCSIENIQRLNKHKTSVSVYCILASVTYKTQMINYTDMIALQCKDYGDKTTLKCKELPKHDSILFFHDRKDCTVANPEIVLSVFFGSYLLPATSF